MKRALSILSRIPSGITLLAAILAIAAFSPWGLAANTARWLAFAVFFTGIAWEMGKRLKPGAVIFLDAVDLAAIAAVSYAACSVAWSSDVAQGLVSAIRMMALLLVFLHVRSHAAELTMKAATPVAMASAVITLSICAWLPGSFGGFFQENFSTEAYLALLPYLFCFTAFGLVLVFREGRKNPAAMAATALGAAIALATLWYLFAVNGSKMEFFVLPALAFYAFLHFDAFRLGGKRFAIGGALAVLAAVIAVFFIGEILATPSVNVRVPMWANSIAMWLDAPLFGHGLGSFRATYPLFGESYLSMVGSGFESQTRANITGDMAHNEYLQAMAEFGIAGILIIAAFLAAAIAHLRRSKGLGLMQEAAAMSLLAILAIACVEFPLHVPATAFIATISLAILLAGDGKPLAVLPLPGAYPRFMARLLLLAFSAGLLVMSALDFRASIHFNQTKILLARGMGEEAFHELDAARRLWPMDSRLRSLLFPTLMRWQRLSGFKYGIDLPAEFYPENVEKIHDISAKAAPNDNGLLNDWLRYLIMSLAFETTPEKTAEIEAGLATLGQRAKLDPDTWVTEGFYALETSDAKRGLAAVARGRELIETSRMIDETARRAIAIQLRWMEAGLLGKGKAAALWKEADGLPEAATATPAATGTTPE